MERVEWFDIEDNPVGATFETGVPYYALITVAPATGAVFADAEAIDVTVNGSELDSVEIKNGKLLIYVIIRKPTSAPIVSPYAFITQPSGGTVNAGESLNVAWQTSFIPTSTEIQYRDGETWDQWDIQYPQNALDDYDFESHEAVSYRFRIVTYIGNDAVATSNEFVINWADVTEYIVVYAPGSGGEGSTEMWYEQEGAQITLDTPDDVYFTPSFGMEFIYWSIRHDGAMGEELAQKQPGETVIITADTYIIAVWAPAAGRMGDVNGDARITNADILRIYRYIYNAALYPLDTEVADVDGSGEVSNGDILKLYQYIYSPEEYPLD